MKNHEEKSINMVQCIYCNKEWVQEDIELICPDCESTLAVDLAVVNLANTINNLKSFDLKYIHPRLKNIVYANKQLDTFIKKIKNKKI